MGSRQQSNGEILNANGPCESSMLQTSFRFSDSKTDLQNFDFESDLKNYLKIKSAFLRSLVHDCGVRNDKKPDISTSIRELKIFSEDILEEPVDDPIKDETPEETQSVELDHSAFSQPLISQNSSHHEEPREYRFKENVARLGLAPTSLLSPEPDGPVEDLLPKKPINLHRKTFRWNRPHHSDQLCIGLSPAKQPSSTSKPSFTEIVMKAFIAGRLLFGTLRKHRKLLDEKRQRISDSLFKEEEETSMIAYVDLSSLAVDVRPMVPITANTLLKDRSLLNAVERTAQLSVRQPNDTPTLGQKINENSSQSNVAQSKIKEPFATKETNKGVQVGGKPLRKNMEATSSSSEDDIEELERLSEARLGKRK